MNMMNEDIVDLGGILTRQLGSANSISWLNNSILKYITSVYGPYGFSYQSGNKDIDVNGKMINTEYIDKMVNNRTIFKKIVEDQSITTEDGFYNYMIANLFDVYHYNGTHFNTITLPILIATTRKGNAGEAISISWLKNKMFQKGVDANMQKPTLLEDIDGIDAKFDWKGKTVTVQVKPYTAAAINGGMVQAHTPGALKIYLSSTNQPVNYLVLYKQEKNLEGKSNMRMICVRGANVNVNGNSFVFKEDDIVFRTLKSI